MKKKNLIVFDMDGVLIDVSKSYRETVRHAALLFFKKARGGETLPDPLFSLSDLGLLKQSGGLNNDWDLTCMAISLLLSLVDIHVEQKEKDSWSRYIKTIHACDVSNLAGFLKTGNKPLTSLMKERGKNLDPFLESLYQDDVGSGNVIKQIFQEIYLGKDLFESTYDIPVNVYSGEGYIQREELLIDRSILDVLSKNSILAIATGRPEKEAIYALDTFNLNDYFSMVCTLDDCEKEEKNILKRDGKKVYLSKPNPYMLDIISTALGQGVTSFYYIGDMPDDMIAASRSKERFISVGMLCSVAEKTHLRTALSQAGADYVFETFDELTALIDSV